MLFIVWVSIDCVLVFFFYKQMTAYEMRISDWSSDVCSSDLRHRIGAAPVAQGEQVAEHGDRHGHLQDQHARHVAFQAKRPGDPEDRKSVVSGKSVSVRVDLGGCRTIKKKKKQSIKITNE